ncbi:MAG: flippase-like domain-containing protein [Clostridia bacterium]|nr:flippase-like domain-containing protein [Clostridia bacterium]
MNEEELQLDENLEKQVNKSRDKRLTIVNILFIIAIFFGLLIYMFAVDGIDNIVSILKSVNYFWVLAGIICMVLSWLSEAICLHIPILKLYPDQKLSSSIRIMMIGQLFNNITPFCSGGQPMQAYYMYKDGRRVSDSFSIFSMKFVISQTALVIFTLIVTIFQWNYFKSLMDNFFILAIVGFSVNIIAIIFIFIIGINQKLAINILKPIFKFLGKIHILKNVDEKIEKLSDSFGNFNYQFNEMRKEKKVVIQMFIAATIQSLFYYAITYMVYRAFGNSGVSLFTIIPAQAFLLMLMTFIPTPGSGGGAEGGFLLIFNSIFKEGTINLSILFWRMYTFYLPILIGALFLIPIHKKDNKKALI